ncbi:hypothetical protein NBRC3280_2599 [Acetobacter pasteurianus NBRC 3280]|uniref:Uncharacterized protein n=1 Tax=Acetobacter pasteurianus NBRC 3278 TaxID=1226660 RepID=A0A401X758_ACEPA|nr:AAA family ATPase [Acetobacter pasteurianus]GCD63596.1 hypothetical protein NBRC3278_2689 [Acetobacter pasteurianus NBRC 3278]GCD69964.1 hypothetical protein NBRC3280_2599 [Acetobacter pasteurianus NBRC 3280]
MRLMLRNDIPLHASTLGYLNKLAEITITKPLVFLTGPNGSGKSLILEAMRTAMHKTGYGFGTELADNGFNGYPIFSRRWQENPANKKAGVDLAFLAVARSHDIHRWGPPEEVTIIPNCNGVLDTDALNWSGQQSYYFSARSNPDRFDDGGFNMPLRRQIHEDRMRSYGEQMRGRLNYALAWATGMIDTPPPKARYETEELRIARMNISEYLKDKPATSEKWLLLDEPETGLDELYLARFFSLLAERSKIGELRVFCATHSPFVPLLSSHPNVQIIDIRDLMGSENAIPDLSNEEVVKQEAQKALSDLQEDLAVAQRTKEHPGQGRFTVHNRRSIPPRHTDMEPYGTESRDMVRHYPLAAVESEGKKD